MAQNIFDDPTFFAEYKNLRENEPNYNDLLEQPAMRALLPDLAGKDVLDIGCGFGHNCRDFVERGARHVVGIDLSEKMLDVAKAQNALPEIEYRRMDMDAPDIPDETFDFVYSSLAFHYAADFPKLCADVFRLLRAGGLLLFSQEHPFTTCSENDSNYYILDENGRAAAYALSHYAKRGRRTGKWFVDDVENYHRTLGDIVTSLARAGFRIDCVVEPEPSEEALQIRPGLQKEFIKPTFLIVRAEKCK